MEGTQRGTGTPIGRDGPRSFTAPQGRDEGRATIRQQLEGTERGTIGRDGPGPDHAAQMDGTQGGTGTTIWTGRDLSHDAQTHKATGRHLDGSEPVKYRSAVRDGDDSWVGRDLCQMPLSCQGREEVTFGRSGPYAYGSDVGRDGGVHPGDPERSGRECYVEFNRKTDGSEGHKVAALPPDNEAYHEFPPLRHSA